LSFPAFLSLVKKSSGRKRGLIPERCGVLSASLCWVIGFGSPEPGKIVVFGKSEALGRDTSTPTSWSVLIKKNHLPRLTIAPEPILPIC